MLRTSDALLVVDVQFDFLPGGALAVPDGDQVVPVLANCIRAFVERELPVFASRDWHPENHCSFAEFGGPWPPHCIAGSDGAQLDPQLCLPEQARIVDKATTAEKDAYSAFEGTDLAQVLESLSVKRLLVGGLATDYCVVSSARDALENGFEVVVMTDAIRAISDEDGERAIGELRQANATIALSGQIIEE